MATFTVTTANDVVASDGVRSLREAVALANATPEVDTIRFTSAVEGHTLTLTQGELRLTQDVTVDGDADNNGSRVTISGGDASRIFEVVGSGTDAALADLTLAHGRPPGPELVGAGGAVLVGGGSLELTGSTVRDNTGYGGGIYAADGSRVSVSNSTIADNHPDWVGADVYASGGGIATGANVALSVRNSSFSGNDASGAAAGTHPDGGGAIHLGVGGHLTIEDSTITGNGAYTAGGILLDASSSATIMRSSIAHNDGSISGGIHTADGDLTILQSAVTENDGVFGAGISSDQSQVTINSSTIATNEALYSSIYGSGYGGGIKLDGGELTLRNSTVTGNIAAGAAAYSAVQPGIGGGIHASSSAHLDLANSIVAGNIADVDSDIHGAITVSDGHNIFGSDVAGNIAGDQENIAASTIFAAIDPATHGGQVNADGIVPLRGSAGNLALSAADLFAAMPTDQLGHARPQPTGSLPDLGAAESSHALSTHPSAGNDVLAGTAAGETISGLDGADRIFGAAGNDTLNGNAGSDVLEGGTGNDKLNGGTGIDTAYYGGATAITADLSGSTDTVHRGSETDTLTGIEGVVGTRAADTFNGRRQRQLVHGRRRQGSLHRRRRPRHLRLQHGRRQPGRLRGPRRDHRLRPRDRQDRPHRHRRRHHEARRPGLPLGRQRRLHRRPGRARLLHLRQQHGHSGQQRHRQHRRAADPAHRPRHPGGDRLRPVRAQGRGQTAARIAGAIDPDQGGRRPAVLP